MQINRHNLFIVKLCILVLGCVNIASADTRMIKHLDIFDVWKYNYNSSHWLEQGNLQIGSQMFGEEKITITQLPTLLKGVDWIQTSYGSKNFKGGTAATFQLTGDAEVFIIHASDIVAKPAWLKGYIKTNGIVVNNRNNRFDILVKQFKKGDTVRLGSNGNTDMSMYIVAVKPIGKIPVLPQPKGKVFDVLNYGAKGDNKTMNTVFIQKAIDDCAAAGGGSVFVHNGIFMTGMLVLKTKVELFVQAGSILRGSPKLSDYPKLTVKLATSNKQKNYQLIFAEESNNITITGGGIIDGYSLSAGWPYPPSMDIPDRPRVMRMSDCKNVTVNNISILRSAYHTLYYEGCDSLRIDNIRIRTYTGQHNLDALDISGCSNAEISNFYSISGDDAICFKGNSARIADNVYVHDILVRHSNCHAVKIGTGIMGLLKNVLVKNVEANARYGAAIESVDGGNVENIVYENFHFSECGVPIFIRLGQRGKSFPGNPDSGALSRMSNITIRNISNDGIGYVDTRGGPGVGSVISGIPGQYIKNLTIENCDFLYYGSLKDPALVYRDIPEKETDYPEFDVLGICPAYGLYARHVKNVTYKNVRLRLLNLDVRPAIVMDDVQGYTLSNINAESFTITEPSPIWHKQDGKLSPKKSSDNKNTSRN